MDGLDLHVLIIIDENSYTSGKNGEFHPMSWYHAFDGGRAFYTALGHDNKSYEDPLYLKHILGGIQYVVGANPKATPTSSKITISLFNYIKRIFSIIVLLAFSMLIYTCTVTKNTTPSKPANPYPTRSFDPTPSVAYLTPEESLKSFNLPPGYHLELVASEPMIKEPVAVAGDGNAKMYVAEMLTYMQDADATGEQLKISRVSLLEDTDNDGKMDKSSVFIDSLLLPRMILCINNELLVNETNTVTINSYKDTNGD